MYVDLDWLGKTSYTDLKNKLNRYSYCPIHPPHQGSTSYLVPPANSANFPDASSLLPCYSYTLLFICRLFSCSRSFCPSWFAVRHLDAVVSAHCGHASDDCDLDSFSLFHCFLLLSGSYLWPLSLNFVSSPSLKTITYMYLVFVTLYSNVC